MRVFLLLLLSALSPSVFAVDYYWEYREFNIRASSPALACDQIVQFDRNRAYTITSGVRVLATNNPNIYNCVYSYTRPDGNSYGATRPMIRQGDSCPAGSTYNPETGSCDVPKDCINNHNVTLEAVCTLSTAAVGSKEVTCPHQVYYEGCSYRRDTSKSETKCYWDLGALPKVYRCQVDYEGGFGSIPPSPDPDAVTCTAAGVCTDSSGNESALNPWGGDTPSANCYMSNGREICRDPSDSECIKVDGSNSCLADDMQCYYENLTLQCIPGDKPQRNCTYFNGQYKCFDPKDPSKEIPSNSSDHPNNGGNADGDDTNDPKQPGTGEETSQGKDDLATNKSIRDLQDSIGDGLDETNSWLEKIHKGLFGGEYDGTGDGKDGDAESSGRATGDLLAQTITEQTQTILEDQEAQSQEFLDKLPSTVTSWFGDAGQNVGLANVLEGVLPSSSGCADYNVNLRLGNYSASMVIPVCDLSRIKPLLEWVIWMVTLIGLWKILYSSLRREDVKASKGGF